MIVYTNFGFKTDYRDYKTLSDLGVSQPLRHSVLLPLCHAKAGSGSFRPAIYRPHQAALSYGLVTVSNQEVNYSQGLDDNNANM